MHNSIKIYELKTPNQTGKGTSNTWCKSGFLTFYNKKWSFVTKHHLQASDQKLAIFKRIFIFDSWGLL